MWSVRKYMAGPGFTPEDRRGSARSARRAPFLAAGVRLLREPLAGRAVRFARGYFFGFVFFTASLAGLFAFSAASYAFFAGGCHPAAIHRRRAATTST
jgi:hypothetical protein